MFVSGRFVFAILLPVLCFKASDYPYGIFIIIFHLISETMILGRVDIYLVDGLPVLLILSIFALSIVFLKMWIVDREVQSTTTSINFEAYLEKPYGKALKEIYSDEQIKRALIYMNQKGKYNT